MHYYLDTAPVIYVVEQVSPYAAWVDARLSDVDTVRVASDLTRLECRVKPLREGNAELLKDYEEFFTGTMAEMITLS